MPKSAEREVTRRSRRARGMGQLTVVEHSLCPLDPDKSLSEGLRHQGSYFYTDKNRHARKAKVQVYCPLGLSASDELYLWGLLALTLGEPSCDGQLHATPHFVLRQLGKTCTALNRTKSVRLSRATDVTHLTLTTRGCSLAKRAERAWGWPPTG